MPGGEARADVLVLQHTASEGPGRVAVALNARGLTHRTIRIDLGEPVPSEVPRALVVMGGPMGVYEADRLPHLRDELALLRAALEANRPILGICLGSQLLAAALGGAVEPSGGSEIGYLPVLKTPEAAGDPVLGEAPVSFPALHWHGDVFELPRGAVSLAQSERTEHQAFRYGARAYGFLFHLEADAGQVRAMASAFAADLTKAGISLRALLDPPGDPDAQVAAVARGAFGRFADLAVAAP